MLPWAEIDGDFVTMHNVRNFEYRTETDYTPSYSVRTYDLRELDARDIIASYWMGDNVAHISVSFGFGSNDYLAVSIETRKEVGESYSTLAGFFRRYEIYYVVADERDLIGLRTNIRRKTCTSTAPRRHARTCGVFSSTTYVRSTSFARRPGSTIR